MAAPFDRVNRPESVSSAGYLAPVPAEPRPSGLTYEPFYGLKEKPFSLTSDSRFFYQSRSHAPAFDELLHAIRRRESLNALTGDIGTGKTTLCRAVLQSLDRKTFSAFVPDPFTSREELLKVLLTDFGVASIDDVTSGRLRNATRTELSYLLHEFLSTLVPLQAFAAVVIDEAQNLSPQLLEEVRILSDADGQLQVLLVGQLELRERLKQPDMRQLDQRVSVHCQLQPLDAAGVAGYISHRVHVAGGSSDRVRFTADAVEAIYLLSGGVPRLINRLCDRALRHGYSNREATIDAAIVEAANPDSRDAASALRASVALPVVPVPPIAAVPEPARVVSAATVLPVVGRPADPAPGLEAFNAERTATTSSMAAAPPTQMTAVAPLPDHLEKWLTEIERAPEPPPVDPEWGQRWNAGSAAPAHPERRSGVRLRIPSVANPHHHTRIDRLRRRWTRRFFSSAVALILLLAALILGPAVVAASLDIWSQVEEQFTAPVEPDAPALPRHSASPPARPSDSQSSDDET